MSQGLYETAGQLGRFVSRKIVRLQNDLLGANSGASTAARASLARLRKLDAPGGGMWIIAGSGIFDEIPDELAHPREMEAIKVALKLFALHQQSKSEPMALTASSQQDGMSKSFGWSCRRLLTDSFSKPGIERRISSVERASRDGLGGVEVHLRALIQLMRASGVSVNYYLLARDLYLMQFESARNRVFQTWARDFYYNSTKPAQEEEVSQFGLQ